MLEHLVDDQGVLLRRHAVSAGFNDNWLRRQVRSRELVRLRQGVYALRRRWEGLDEVGRHLVLCHAVLQLYGDDVALSHGSACVARGGPNWGLDLANVHLTNLFGTSERNAARVVHHRGHCLAGDVSRLNGAWITAPARTAMETAALLPLEPAVCVLDWHLERGLATPEDYLAQLDLMAEWPGTLGLRLKTSLANGRAQSVGETLFRLFCRAHGLPMPELQWAVHHPDGRLAGICDFAWPEHRTLGEFDGKQKYLRMRKPGETIEQAVLREKRREDVLRELSGWPMIRVDWPDLWLGAVTAARVEQMLFRRGA